MQGMYELGPTPLVVHWKDAATSNWFIDTDKDGTVLPQQQVVLAWAAGGALVTGDSPPVTIATLPSALVAQYEHKLRPGLLVKCVVGDQGMDVRPVLTLPPSTPECSVYSHSIQRLG